MRTVKEPDVRKGEILEGAIRVFAEKGYDGATISTIAKELNISQGLCYRYFPSKEDIYTAAVEKYADMFLSAYLAHRNADKHIKEHIDGIAESIASLIYAEGKDEGLYALFHGKNSERLHNDLMLKVAEKILPYIQQSLVSAKEKGEITIENPEMTAVIGLYGQLGTFFIDNISDEERMTAIHDSWDRLLGLK